ncbi:MAG: hypothetical protein K6F86_05940 [Lachnospiraceae bacterium]|nr:hypothetical protein [Lachnospiraceae bacterium]
MMENKALFYNELKNNLDQVREQLLENSIDPNCLKDACLAVWELFYLSRKEGTLSLEAVREKESIKNLICGKELSSMIDLLVNGADPEVIEDIFLKRYYSRNYCGLEGFLYLFYLDSILYIQSTPHSWDYEENIKSYMPIEIGDEISSWIAACEKKAIDQSEADWKTLMERDLPVDNTNSEYYIIKLVDYCLTEMNDNDIQRLLRDIDNNDDALIMKGLSGNALKRLHDNLSPRLFSMLLEDMRYIGPVDLSEIAGAANVFFRVMLKLDDTKEISIPKIPKILFGNTDKTREI